MHLHGRCTSIIHGIHDSPKHGTIPSIHGILLETKAELQKWLETMAEWHTHGTIHGIHGTIHGIHDTIKT